MPERSFFPKLDPHLNVVEEELSEAPSSPELEELLELEAQHGSVDESEWDPGQQEAAELAAVQEEHAAISSLVDTLTPPQHTCGRCLQLVFESVMCVAMTGPFRNNWVCVDDDDCKSRLQAAAGTRRKRKAPTQHDA